MKKWRKIPRWQRILALAIVTLALAQIFCGYYRPGSDYRFSFKYYDPVDMVRRGPPNCGSPCIFEGTFLHRAPSEFESHYDTRYYKGEEALHFDLTDYALSVALQFPQGYAGRVPLQPGQTYQITSKVFGAFPDTYGLIIQEDDQLVFQAVNDWDAGRTITFVEDSPIQVRRHSTIFNRFSIKSLCSIRLFNTRIAFSLDDDEILLRQGQSKRLGPYEISLDFATDTDVDLCTDWSDGGISYTISRVD